MTFAVMGLYLLLMSIYCDEAGVAATIMNLRLEMHPPFGRVR
jgi:hypothetical protein